ncbi:MAG: type IV pilin [Methanoregula sp.]|jgi:hypothetical protein
MQYLKRITRDKTEYAVSPVVGVMLMLVVVIIIAAVVSGFAGSLVGGDTQKVPRLTMDLKIANNGIWSTSYFKGEVTSVSAPINTRDLKIVTSWIKDFHNGTTLRGGATTTPGIVNTNVIYDTHGGGGYDLWRLTVPYGYGVGVGQNSSLMLGGGNVFWTIDGGGSEIQVQKGQVPNASWWGNYKLQAGTMFLARPFGGQNSGQSAGSGSGFKSGYGVKTRFQYNYSALSEYVPGDTNGCVLLSMEGGPGTPEKVKGCSSKGWLFPYPDGPDQMPNVWIPYVESLPPGWDPRTFSIDQIQGVLGNHWEVLRSGDVVHVKFIHIPTGKTVWEKDVVVEGSNS